MCGKPATKRLGGRRPALDRGSLALVGAAFLFGTTFVVVQDAVEEVQPIPFLAVRFGIGSLVLVPLALANRRRRRPVATSGHAQYRREVRTVPKVGGPLVRAGAVAGLALTTGYVFQTVGLQYTTSSVSAFVTYLLVVFVPLLSALVLRRPPATASVVGVGIALAGLVLLTSGDGVEPGKGELLTLGCAIAFAVHILVIDRVAAHHDVVALTAVQLLTVTALLAGPGLVTGGYDLTAGAWAAALYTGVVVTAVAFGLQVWGQRHVSPTRTALLLMLEPVFAGLVGYATGERLGAAGLAGAALILAGIVVSEAGALVVPRPEEP